MMGTDCTFVGTINEDEGEFFDSDNEVGVVDVALG